MENGVKVLGKLKEGEGTLMKKSQREEKRVRQEGTR